ncbi:MAG: hypothetical protein AB1Z98_12105, partial [Nannocystaceae bacterium]
ALTSGWPGIGVSVQGWVHQRHPEFVAKDPYPHAEPEGRANWNVSVGLGPVLGIEYFVGHRVSLSLQGDAQLRFGIFRGLVQTELATGIDAGGQMGLTFYF